MGAKILVRGRKPLWSQDSEVINDGGYTDRADRTATGMMDRNNEAWLAHLSNDTQDQRVALSELREALLARLRRAFFNSARVDDAFLEDAVQDSLVRILDRIEQFEGRSKFLTWATSIAIRVAMSELRRRRWKDVSLDEVIAEADFAPRQVVDEKPGADTQLERKALLDKMHDLIQSDLTEKQRVALVAELRGMPQNEIARHMGSNRNAIYKLTHGARKRLREALESAGYDAADIRNAFSD